VCVLFSVSVSGSYHVFVSLSVCVCLSKRVCLPVNVCRQMLPDFIIYFAVLGITGAHPEL